MQENINIITWAEIVQKIGFAEALVLILLVIISMILAWIFLIQGRKIEKVVDAIDRLKQSMDKLLNIEEIKARMRKDPAAPEISEMVNGKDEKEKSSLIDMNKKREEKGRLEYEKLRS